MTKIIITEAQLKQLTEVCTVDEYIGPINESVDFSSLWAKYKKAILAGVSAVAIMMSINNLPVDDFIKNRLKHNAEAEMAEEKEDTVFTQKVDAVRKYMETAIKNQGYNSENLALSPEVLVTAAQEGNFDLPLLMAQAHLESCFGMTPRARKTGSVFSVGCYDNGKNAVTYSDQNDSVPSYIRLIKNDYLGDNKTLSDLLAPNGFVNKIGKRYAQDPNYESKVKSIRNRIIKNYPILAQTVTL